MPNCHICGQPVDTWQEWFGGDCPIDPRNGHDLRWDEIKALPAWKDMLISQTEAKEKMK